MNNAYDKFASHARMHPGNSISCAISPLDGRYAFGRSAIGPFAGSTSVSARFGDPWHLQGSYRYSDRSSWNGAFGRWVLRKLRKWVNTGLE